MDVDFNEVEQRVAAMRLNNQNGRPTLMGVDESEDSFSILHQDIKQQLILMLINFKLLD